MDMSQQTSVERQLTPGDMDQDQRGEEGSPEEYTSSGDLASDSTNRPQRPSIGLSYSLPSERALRECALPNPPSTAPTPTQAYRLNGKGSMPDSAPLTEDTNQNQPTVLPGAYAAKGRAIGDLPAWARRRFGSRVSLAQTSTVRRFRRAASRRFRRRSRRSSEERQSNSNIPPELRVRQSRICQMFGSGVSGTTTSAGQNNSSVPPELQVRPSLVSRMFRSGRNVEETTGSQPQAECDIEATCEMSGNEVALTAPESQQRNLRKLLWLVLSLILLVGIAIVVVIGVGVTKKGGQRSIGREVNITSFELSPAPSPMLPIMEQAMSIELTVSYLVRDSSVWDDPTSPQSLALEWIKIPSMHGEEVYRDPERLKTRFALAVLYYSMNGNEWPFRYAFLSPVHECGWGDRRDTAPGGIRCDVQDRVTSLHLGTCSVYYAKVTAECLELSAVGLLMSLL